MNDMNTTPAPAPTTIQPAPEAAPAAPPAAPAPAAPVQVAPAPAGDPYLERLDALLGEYQQQKRRSDMVAKAAKAELQKFAESEGGQMIAIQPVTDIIGRLLDELGDTHLSLAIDHLKLLKQAAEEDQAEFDQDMDGEDEGEGEAESVLFDQDASFIAGTLDQYRVMLEQTLPQQAEGETKRTLNRLLLQAKQALDLVESISIYSTEESDDGAQPSAD